MSEAKVTTIWDYDRWFVDVCKDTDKLGREYQESDSQDIIHEKSNYALFDDAMNALKDGYGMNYDRAVESHAIFYTSALKEAYPNEVIASKWTPKADLDTVHNFTSKLATRAADFDLYRDRDDFENLIDDVASLYCLKKNGTWDLGSTYDHICELEDGTLINDEQFLVERVVNEAHEFDTYDFNDNYVSKDEACHELLVMFQDSEKVKNTFNSLLEHFEEVQGQPSKHKDAIKHFDEMQDAYAKKQAEERISQAEAVSSGIVKSDTQVSVQKDS